MQIPKTIKFNNNKYHSIEIIYKALEAYKKECDKSKYYYENGKKKPNQLYFESKDANRAMNFILNEYHKQDSKKHVDPYSYETARKNMMSDRNEMLKRKQEEGVVIK